MPHKFKIILLSYYTLFYGQYNSKICYITLMKNFYIIIFLFILFSTKANAQDFNSCKLLYDDQKYNTSVDCFYNYLQSRPQDTQARFWYAAALFFDRQYNMSYSQYNYIAQKYPNSEIGRYSQQEAQKVYQKMQYVKQSKANDKGSYINSLTYKTKWYNSPIKVWIQSSPYSMTAKRALGEWQYKSSGTVKFAYVTDPKRAQIKIYFVNKINQPVSDQNIGLTSLKYIGNMNLSANIQILQRTDSGKMRTYGQIYPVILHETGHALGMSGHSSSNNDIMYENNYTNSSHLSQKDVNTLKMIYK